MTDYAKLDTDALHLWLDDAQSHYDDAREFGDYDTEQAALADLIAISSELRKRHQLWIKTPHDVLLKRYTAGLTVAPLDPIMDEWQEEMTRRGLPVPTEGWEDEAAAYAYWHDPSGSED